MKGKPEVTTFKNPLKLEYVAVEMGHRSLHSVCTMCPHLDEEYIMQWCRPLLICLNFERACIQASCFFALLLRVIWTLCVHHEEV
mmetsp:Transcript_64989/g.108908  ORF Transcript_64989/g.108908 Transcript_64989/m.108908 type:complete len:85 (-) Transcript_64989:224-478(-)